MNIYDFKVKNRQGDEISLEQFKGKVLIIVNTATGCGFTPQYKGLEELYEAYHEQGLEILDFPCNQFGHQAPGSDDEIHEFCTAKYDTKFDQFAKIEVNGDNAAPLFAFLKENQPDEEIFGTKNKLAMKAIKKRAKSTGEKGFIKWNFTKFLVDRDGNVVKRYAPTTEPKKMEEDLKELL